MSDQVREEPAPGLASGGPALREEAGGRSVSSRLSEEALRAIIREEISAAGKRTVERVGAVVSANRRDRDARTPALLLEGAAKRLGDVADLLEHREAPGPVFAGQVREIQRELRVLVDELLERVVGLGQAEVQGVMHDSSSGEDGQPLESADGSVARTLGEAADTGSSGLVGGGAAVGAAAPAPEVEATDD